MNAEVTRSLLKYSLREGAGPAKIAEIAANLVGRVPSSGATCVFQQDATTKLGPPNVVPAVVLLSCRLQVL
jgi:hypothetical protein